MNGKGIKNTVCCMTDVFVEAVQKIESEWANNYFGKNMPKVDLIYNQFL